MDPPVSKTFDIEYLSNNQKRRVAIKIAIRFGLGYNETIKVAVSIRSKEANVFCDEFSKTITKNNGILVKDMDIKDVLDEHGVIHAKNRQR